MSNINQTSKEIKQKLSFQDYSKPAEQQTSTPAPQQAGTNKKQKVKVTYYLNDTDNKALTDIYIKRLQADNKTDKSALIAEAIQLLYKKELA